jgi:hypothetical protein
MFKWTLSHLERANMIKIQLMAYICKIDAYDRIKAHYRKTYKQPLPKSNELPIGHDRSILPPGWLYWLISNYRRFTISYVCYVLVRELLGTQIESILRRIGVELKLPIRCYLLGRYILDGRVDDLATVLMAWSLIIWVAIEKLTKPYNMSVAYFLFLDERDLGAIYSMLGPDNSMVLTLDQARDLSAQDQLVLDTMFYRQRQQTCVVYRLRSNRTREAHQELRRFLAKMTLSTVMVNGTLLTIILGLIAYVAATDEHYLQKYPDCNPELQQLKAKAGRLAANSITLTGHHSLAFMGDLLENLIYWVEGCLMCTYVPVVANFCVRDLLIQWRHIDRRIGHLRRQAMDRNLGKTRRVVVPARGYENVMSLLVAEISDFFGNVDKANAYMSHWLNNFVGWCLVLCISYAYLTRVRGIQHLSVGLAFVMCYVAAGVAAGSYASLIVHRTCTRSYARLCSLMAYDLSKRKHDFETIIELFVQERSCFWLFYQYRFKATTLLTTTGWALSLFCISAGLLQRGIVKGASP